MIAVSSIRGPVRVGAAFPSRGVPPTKECIEEWVNGVVELGLDHVAVSDHVLGVDPDVATAGWDAQYPGGPKGASIYSHEATYHEPFVLLAFMAALCPLELSTGVLVLPQRQTALVAKQAVELDVLSGGRLRLCVGVGWNAAEYEALGVPFNQRGRILDEQIEVLQQFWTHPTITYEGEFHHLKGVGTQVRPLQQPIPLWMGGNSQPALERAGRLGGGWFAMRNTSPEVVAERWAVIREAAQRAEREDIDELGLEVRLDIGDDAGPAFVQRAQDLLALAPTHLCIDTQQPGRTMPAHHLEALSAAVSALTR